MAFEINNFLPGIKAKSWHNKVLFVVLSAYFLAYFLFLLSFPRTVVLGSDLKAFLTGAQIVSQGKGSRLFDLNLQYEIQVGYTGGFNEVFFLPFRYSPFLAVFFLPLSIFTLETAFKIFLVINFFCLLIFYRSTLITFPSLKKYWGWLLMVFSSWSCFRAFSVGQVSFWALLICWSVYLLFMDRHYFWAGVTSGFLAFKLQYFFLLPFLFLLAGKSWKKYLMGLALSGSFLLGLCVKVSGLNFLSDYLILLSQTEKPIYGSRDAAMFSFFPYFKKVAFFFGFPIWTAWTMLGLAYLLALNLYRRNLDQISDQRGFLVAMLMSLSLFPHLLSPDLILLLIPICILIGNPSKYFKGHGYQRTYLALFLYVFPFMDMIDCEFLGPFLLLASGLFWLKDKQFKEMMFSRLKNLIQ